MIILFKRPILLFQVNLKSARVFSPANSLKKQICLATLSPVDNQPQLSEQADAMHLSRLEYHQVRCFHFSTSAL